MDKPPARKKVNRNSTNSKFFQLVFLALFSIALQAGLANAATNAAASLPASETAALFLNETELPSMAVAPFTSGTGKYFVVKSEGRELLVLRENEGNYAAVEGPGAIEALVNDYKRGNAPEFTNETLVEIKAKISELNATYEYCAEPMRGFLNSGTLLFWILQVDDRGSPVPHTTNAINRIRGNYTWFNNGTSVKTSNGSAEILEDGFADAAIAAAALEDPAASTFELSEKLNSLYQKIGGMKAVAGNYSTDFAYLKSRHPENLRRRDCNLSAQSFEPLEETLDAQGALLDAAGLAKKMADFVAERKPQFEARKSLLKYKKDYAALASEVNSIQAALAPANVSPSSLKRKLLQLERAMQELSNAQNLPEARRKEDEFTRAYAKASLEAKALEESGMLEKINESVSAVMAAKNAVATLEEKGAQANDVQDARKKYLSLKTELDDALFWVEFGGKDRINASDFTNITAKARVFANETTGLATRTLLPFDLSLSNPLVPIALVAGIAGAAYYFKTRKPKGL